jgi:hypothetical protein
MLVGDAAQRTKKGTGLKTQTCFRCYSGPNFGGDNAAPCADAKSVKGDFQIVTQMLNYSLQARYRDFLNRSMLGWY